MCNALGLPGVGWDGRKADILPPLASPRIEKSSFQQSATSPRVLSTAQHSTAVAHSTALGQIDKSPAPSACKRSMVSNLTTHTD